MSTDSDVEAALNLVSKRIDFLEFLDGERRPKRVISEELGYSRSTVNRAIAKLSDAGLVDDAPRGCQTTFVGSLLADQYDEYVRVSTTILANREVLTSLSLDTKLPSIVLTDAEVTTPGDSSPYGPFNAVEALLERAVGQVRVYVPTFTNPRGIELAQGLATKMDVEIVFDGALISELRSDIPTQIQTLVKLDNFTGYTTSTGPNYSLIIVTTESGLEGAIVIHTAEKELVGCLVSENPDATQWMEQRYAEIRAESEPLQTAF